jgi:hypothetical protein
MKAVGSCSRNVQEISSSGFYKCIDRFRNESSIWRRVKYNLVGLVPAARHPRRLFCFVFEVAPVLKTAAFKLNVTFELRDPRFVDRFHANGDPGHERRIIGPVAD